MELSLDGRQLFFVFFGGAIGACLLFALGVMTGRRIEARAIAMEAPSTDDPLAQLDQLGDLEDEELTYRRALTKDAHGKHAATPATPTLQPQAAQPKPAPKPVVKPAAAKHADADAPASITPASIAQAPSAPAAVAANDKPATSHFTLQLSAFTAKRDADDFKRRVEAAGYHPLVVTADVAGKGTLYRVRVGDYASKESALAEKTTVEKRLKVAAYLAKI